MTRFTTKRWMVTEEDGKTPNLDSTHKTIDDAHQVLTGWWGKDSKRRVRPVKITVEYLDE